MVRKKATETSAKIWNKDLQGGETIEGTYLKKEIFDGKFGSTEKYIIEVDGGEHFAVFASASLTRQFANIPEGSYVWITYKGEEMSKNNRKVKVYDVDYDDDLAA